MNLKFFKKEKKFVKKEHQPNPDFYWKIVLFVMMVLFLCSLAFGGYLFLEVNKEDTTLPTEYHGQSQKISKDRIDKVLEYFSGRETKSQDIINFPSPMTDPSF